MLKLPRTMVALAALLTGIAWGASCQAQKAAPPVEGGSFPDVRMSVPSRPEARKYLGVNAKGTFRFSQMKAEVVIVEVFSMYCPYCQREAPSVNELYRIIDSRPDLRDRIKMVGIGAGNSSFEVDLFTEKYKVPFPLLPDPDFTVHRALGEVRTPYFIAVKLSKDGQRKVLYSKPGSPGEPAQFLESLIQLAQLR